MSVLVDANTRLLVQGITGKSGSFHASACKEYGTQVVAGVTPARGGEKFEETVPIFDTVSEAVAATRANASMIFVPPEFAGDAILEAADAGIQLIVAITEGIPVMGYDAGATRFSRALLCFDWAELSWHYYSRGLQDWHYAGIYSSAGSCGGGFAQWDVDL